jgi:predicted metal-dependent peptidase
MAAPTTAPLDALPTTIEAEALTPQQKAQWGDTMSLMTWTCPGFRHLFYKLLTNNRGEIAAVPSRKVPIAATDGRNIIINPDTFFKLSLPERVFAIGHEIVHNVFNDVQFLHRCGQAGVVPMSDGTTRPFINEMMQHSMDYRINALLQDSRIGTPIKGVCLNPEVGKADESVVDIYKKIYDDAEADGRIVPGNLPGWVLQPGASTGQSPAQANAAHNPAQWAVETAAAHQMEALRTQGKMAHALQRFFNQILNPVVPWTDHIRGIFNRKVGSGSYNWRKPDRRFITRDLYMPSRSGNGAGWVVVWADTSGSIGQDELCRYMAELTEIMETCQPKRLTICWCDAAIHRVDELEEVADMEHMRADIDGDDIGGGGTDMHPVLDWIDGQTDRPEIMIALTDGYVTFPEAQPDFLMIWASTTNDVEYPFGDVVHINPQAA